MPTTHIYVDTYMSEESLKLLLADARDAMRRNETVDIHVATSHYASTDEFKQLINLAFQTHLPDKIIHRTNAYTRHYGGYLRERLEENVLAYDVYDIGMGPLPMQQPTSRIRWILELDDTITFDKLLQLLNTFPYFDAATGAFKLFISGKNAEALLAEYDEYKSHLRNEEADMLTRAILLDD